MLCLFRVAQPTLFIVLLRAVTDEARSNHYELQLLDGRIGIPQQIPDGRPGHCHNTNDDYSKWSNLGLHVLHIADNCFPLFDRSYHLP